MILTIICILFVIFISKEIVRKNKKRLIYRVAACIVMLLGVIGLLIKPSYLTATLNKAVILTDYFDQSVLDSLKETDKNIKVAQLNEIGPDEYHEVCVLGEGLESFDFEVLKTLKVNFIPSNLPNGISQIEYAITQTQDKSFKIRGNCHCPSESRVLIEGPEGKIDSIQNATNFEFEVKPKVVGRQLYYLEYWEDSVLIERNPVPVNVQAPVQLNVLILNSFPTFESNHVKQFLGSKNHAVTVRNRVSENRFSYEFVNTNRTEVRTLTSKMLEKFDLLIIDQKEWLTLTNNDRLLLENEVNNGLGLLLHGIYSNAFSKSVFTDFDVKERAANYANEFMYESVILTTKGFSFANPKMLLSFPSTNTVEVSAFKLIEKGKVAVMLANNTYRMNLKGEEEVFASFWSNHIDLLANSKGNNVEIYLEPNISWELHPMDVRLITMKKDIPNVEINSTKLNMKQSVLQDEVWSGKYWSKNSGWHKISNSEDHKYFYIYDSNDWKSLRTTQKIKANKHQFSQQKIDLKQKHLKRQIPLFYAFLLFIIGAGYLWIEAKL